MKICSLYSGSSGNAVYMNLGGHSILIDAGKSARVLCGALRGIGISIDSIEAIYITHEHRDHTAAINNLLKKHNIPVHMPAPCLERVFCAENEWVANNLVTHPVVYTDELGSLTVTSFETPHDSLASVGFRFEFVEGGRRHTVGYATDIGHLSSSVCEGLMGCEAVVLECNHDVDMLREGPYPDILKQRILSRRGHLSNTDCAALAARLAENGTSHILLAHISEINNTPSIAYDEVFSAVAGSGVTLAVASPTEPTCLIDQTLSSEASPLC